jgi:hypothetical protein
VLIFSYFTIVAVLFAAIERRWDFPVPRSSDAGCLFWMRSRRLSRLTTNVVGSSKEQPQNSAEQAHDQYRQKDEAPRTCAGQSGEIDLSSGAAKHEAKALGVIIKTQNMLHSPASSRTCRWQLHRLLNDKESFRPRANLTIKRKKAKWIGRTIFDRQSKDRRVECSGPAMKAPFFHSLRYSRPSHHGYGASVRSSHATCENIFTTSFEVDRSSADEEDGLDDHYGC